MADKYKPLKWKSNCQARDLVSQLQKYINDTSSKTQVIDITNNDSRLGRYYSELRNYSPIFLHKFMNLGIQKHVLLTINCKDKLTTERFDKCTQEWQ